MKSVYKNYHNYEIYSDGSIFSLTSNKFLKPYKSKYGYLTVCLTNDFGKKWLKVHRIIAECFIPNPLGKPEVNHIDCDKTNNNVSNLEWVSSKENKEHAWENNLYSCVGEDHPDTYLTNETVHLICRDIQDGMRSIDICKEYNLPKHIVADIRCGKNWAHISKTYSFNVVRKQRKSLDKIHTVCKMLQDNVSISEIVSTVGCFTRKDIRRIQTGVIHKNISSQYNLSQRLEKTFS